MTHDVDQVGPLALSVGLLVATIAYRKSWPRIAVSSKYLSRRLQLDPGKADVILDALAATGYLFDSGDVDHRGWRQLRATVPEPLEPSEETPPEPSEKG